MFANRYRCLTCLFALAVGGFAYAQEPAPSSGSAADVEKAYLDLRDSQNRTTQRFAERYLNLIRQQEWSNDSGSSKVLAKYVSHDPNLKWVRLAVVRGSGKDKSTREVNVPVDKLNKSCQSRVRQIATLQAKLDELLAAEKDSGTAGGGYGGYAGEREEAAPRGRGGYSGYDAPGSEAGSGEQPAEPAVSPEAVDTGADDPDPLGFGELANEPPLDVPGGFDAPDGGGIAASGFGVPGAVPGSESVGGTLDRTKWASDFMAFHVNFSVSPGSDGTPTIDWGELTDLHALNEAAVEHARNSAADPYRSQLAEISERLGEVRWQAGFLGIEPSATGGSEVRFALPPLPEPLSIRFFVDESEQAVFADLRRGQPVKFVGRFDVRTPNEIRVQIRAAN